MSAGNIKIKLNNGVEIPAIGEFERLCAVTPLFQNRRRVREPLRCLCGNEGPHDDGGNAAR